MWIRLVAHRRRACSQRPELTPCEQLLAIGNTPSHPIVRVVDGNPALIKQVLDIGAQTILVPMIDTAQQSQGRSRGHPLPAERRARCRHGTLPGPLAGTTSKTISRR